MALFCRTDGNSGALEFFSLTPSSSSFVFFPVILGCRHFMTECIKHGQTKKQISLSKASADNCSPRAATRTEIIQPIRNQTTKALTSHLLPSSLRELLRKFKMEKTWMEVREIWRSGRSFLVSCVLILENFGCN